MKIRRDDFVLEIGSGDNPRPRSDVLCDKFIEDDAERGGGIVKDRPLIEADARALPFADGAFDYVICSHVLEHVEEVERVLVELMRVASRGYIETPSEVAERLYGWPFHRSVVNLIDGRLFIRRKTFTPQFGQLFHILADRDRAFSKFHRTHNDLLLVRHEWEGRIDYTIVPDNASPLDLGDRETVEALWRRDHDASWAKRSLSVIKSAIPRRVAAWAKSFLARSRQRPRRDIHEIVICPACGGPVAWGTEQITCAGCHASYPIVRGVPRMVPRVVS